MSFGNTPGGEDSTPEDVSYNEFQRVVRERNKPKHGWRENGVMSISEFNRLREAEGRIEYREIWREIKKERRQERHRDR